MNIKATGLKNQAKKIRTAEKWKHYKMKIILGSIIFLMFYLILT